MYTQSLIVLFTISAFLNVGLAVYGWRNRRLPGAAAFSLAMLMFATLPLMQAINESNPNSIVKIIALKSRVEAAGIGATAWLVMMMQLSGYAHLVNRRLLLALSVMPLIILILNWTEHPLFRSGYYLDSQGILRWTTGPVFWLALVYMLALLLTPLYLLWRSYGRISPLSLKQTLALSLAVVLPIFINILTQLNIIYIPEINFPFAAGPLMGLIVVWAVFRYHVFDLVPFARSLLIESMSDGVLVLDAQNRIVDINAAMRQLIGPIPLGQSAELVFAAWPDLLTKFRNIHETRSEISIEGNPPSHFELHISALSEQGQQWTGRLVVVRDITTRKQREEQLRLQAAALDAAANAIVITDRKGLIQWVNAAFTRLTGYTFTESLGQNMRMLRSNRHSKSFYENLSQTIEAGLIWEDEIINRRKDGKEYVEQQTITPIKNEQDEISHFIAIKQDYTARRRMEEELRRQNNFLVTLHQVTIDLLNRRNLDDLLQGIVDRAVEILDVPYCEIMFLEEQELVVRAFSRNRPFLSGDRIRREDARLSWQAFDTHRPVIVNDYAHWPQRRLIYEDLHLSAVLALPILVGDRCIGVLELSRAEPGRGFDDSDIQAATLFAQLAALALDNTNLFTNAIRQSQELRLLQEVGTAITSELDLHRIVKRTVDAIAETFGYTLVSLYLLENEVLTLQHQVGYETVIPQIPISEGIAGRVIRTAKPVFLEDVRADPSFLGAIEGIMSEVAVPILDEGKAVGVLNVESRPDVRLTLADLQLMLALSDQISIALGRARVYAELQRKNEGLSIMHEIGLELLNQRGLEELPQMITDQLIRLLQADGSYIVLREGDELVDRAITPHDFPYPMTRRKRDGDPIWDIYDSRQPLVTHDFSALHKVHPQHAELGIRAALFLPIVYGDVCTGVLAIVRLTPDFPFKEDDIRFGSLFARLVAAALDNAQMHETLRQESIRDPLTGLFNRRFMYEAFLQELHRAERNSSALAVVMLDLDHFKHLNDTYGHDAGDAALRKLGLLLKTHIRGSDIACRFGGEEFILILSDTELKPAMQRMDQLRQDIKELPFHYGEKSAGRLSGSFGIATYPQHGRTTEQLIKAADEALYRAKQAGRDCVMVAQG